MRVLSSHGSRQAFLRRGPALAPYPAGAVAVAFDAVADGAGGRAAHGDRGDGDGGREGQRLRRRLLDDIQSGKWDRHNVEGLVVVSCGGLERDGTYRERVHRLRPPPLPRRGREHRTVPEAPVHLSHPCPCPSPCPCPGPGTGLRRARVVLGHVFPRLHELRRLQRQGVQDERRGVVVGGGAGGDYGAVGAVVGVGVGAPGGRDRVQLDLLSLRVIVVVVAMVKVAVGGER